MNKLLIVSRQEKAYRQLLAEARLPGLEITDTPEHATIILADPPRIAAELDDYPALHWLQSTFAGVDALIRPTLRQDYTLTNIRGHFGQLIAEYVMGYTLDHIRHLGQYRQQQARQQWQPLPYASLNQKTMIILGTGSIGAHLARAAKAFGLTLIGINRSGTSAEASFDQVLPLARLSEGLSRADIVVSTLPATPETNELLGASNLGHCHNALLFNVGRGNTVCEQGLLTAIAKGCIAHAYLDVFKQEPLDKQHAFWQHPNITITPHIAAESFPEQVFEIFEENYRRYIQQQPLMYLVDFTRGY